jgi:hypothetical protein
LSDERNIEEPSPERELEEQKDFDAHRLEEERELEEDKDFEAHRLEETGSERMMEEPAGS